MKKLIFFFFLFILLSGISYAQQTLDSNRTYYDFNVNDSYENLSLTLTAIDGSNDSIQVIAIFSNPYAEVVVGTVRQSDNNKRSMILIDSGSSETYSLYNCGAGKYRVSIKNSSAVGRKVIIRMAKNSGLLPPLSEGLDSNRLAFLSKDNIFTGTNTFVKLIADTIVVDIVTTAESFKIVYNDTTYAEFDAARDTFWMPKLYVGNLMSNTHINNTSVTTNSLNANIINSDTIHPSSPLILDADSTIGKNIYSDSIKTKGLFLNGVKYTSIPTFDTTTFLSTAHTWSGNNIFNGNILMGTSNKIGTATQKGDSILFVHGIMDTIKSNKITILGDTLLLGNSKIFSTSNSLKLWGYNGWALGFSNSVTPASQLSWSTGTPNSIYLSNGIGIVPNNNNTSDLGQSNLFYKSIYSLKINIGGTSIDSCFLSGDTLKFKVGANYYNAVKGSGFEVFGIILLIGVGVGLFRNRKQLLITSLIFFFAVSCYSQDTIKTQYVITNWGKANTKYTVEYTVKEKNGKIKLSKVNKSKLKDLITISKKKKSKKGGKAGSEQDSVKIKETYVRDSCYCKHEMCSITLIHCNNCNTITCLECGAKWKEGEKSPKVWIKNPDYELYKKLFKLNSGQGQSQKEQDSTQYKKLISDYEVIVKNYNDLIKKLNEINEQKLKMEGILEYLQYQIQEEKKKLEK